MRKPEAIVIGAGAGGAVAARVLQGRYQVTILEEGPDFRPFRMGLRYMEALRRTGLVFSERQIELFYPAMRIRQLPGLVLVRGRGPGGSTTISCGNGMRLDNDLKAIGIDLDEEFAQLRQEVPITADTRHLWRAATQRVFATCTDMGLDPLPIPKMGRYERCCNCGRCMLGCTYDVKWDSRSLLRQALRTGARLLTGCRVQRVEHDGAAATGVVFRQGPTRRSLPADLVVLAAGGLGTPVILQNSHLACQSRLFVDPVLTVGARWPGAQQAQEFAMPFVISKERYIIAPYFDYLSFIFNRSWRRPAGDLFGLMVKLADEPLGAVAGRQVRKPLTAKDQERLAEAASLCRDIFHRCGVQDSDIFLGTLNAGHPGGALPLTTAEAPTLHHRHLPANLYVADATLLPHALGAPNILTVMALAIKVANTAAGQHA